MVFGVVDFVDVSDAGGFGGFIDGDLTGHGIGKDVEVSGFEGGVEEDGC